LSRAVGVLGCVPAITVALIGAWALVANTAGGWVWPPDEVNVSEAVATGNYAELVAQVEVGADPTRSRTVRAPFLSSEAVTVTPLEAAVLGRNATMMELLLARGVVVTPSMAGALKCLNAAHPDQDVKNLLDKLVPGDMPACPAEK
jgi:hypothetical protein